MKNENITRFNPKGDIGGEWDWAHMIAHVFMLHKIQAPHFKPKISVSKYFDIVYWKSGLRHFFFFIELMGHKNVKPFVICKIKITWGLIPKPNTQGQQLSEVWYLQELLSDLCFEQTRNLGLSLTAGVHCKSNKWWHGTGGIHSAWSIQVMPYWSLFW